MKKIGIVGYGKMGKEIFQYYYPLCKETEFIVYCRHDKETYAQELGKALQKLLKRKRITEEVFEFQKVNLCFTDSYEDFKGCEMIIESVAENLEVKQQVFAELEKVVSDKCLLLTNTSSLSIEAVFENMKNPERCFGLHYFYPLKLTGFAELNILPDTSEDAVKKVYEWVASKGKQPLIFKAPYHIYLNQFIFTAISSGIYFRKKTGCSVEKLEEAFKEFFPIGGLFGLIDSIGLELLTKSADAFEIERTARLHKSGIAAMEEWKSAGCPSEPNSFLEFISKKEEDLPDKDIVFPAETIIALLMNEAVFALAESGTDSELLMNALQDAVGLAKTFSEYSDAYGTEHLRTLASQMHEAEPELFHEPCSEDKWKLYFK